MSEQQFDPLNQKEWLTSTEAATLTGYSIDAFSKAAKRGALHGVKRGNARFFRRDDILAYVALMNALGTKKHTPKRYRDEQNSKETA